MNRFQAYIGEMIGRIQQATGLYSTYNLNQWSAVPTEDASQVNYTLTRAIFYASVVSDPITGTKYGKDYLLGAGFGKPIVNSAAAFTIGKLFTVASEDKGSDDQLQEINDWLEERRSTIFKTVRNSFRDGDSYFRLQPDLSSNLIAPHRVEKITDPVTGKLIGYDITAYTQDRTDRNIKFKYVEELRTTSPFRRVMVYKNGNTKGTVMANTLEEGDGERPLPIVHFANEAEPDQKYGNSEYQNCYYYMGNYHSIFEHAIKNNIYNSNALPILTGIENIAKFKEANGTKDNKGEYRVKWDAQKLLMGGKGFDAKIIQAVQNASDADKLLNLLFWAICQTSETPEFVFGTAVQSSKASVQEQTPIAINKALRKQGEFTEPFAELVKLYLYYAKNLNSKVNTDMGIKIKWSPILDDDLKLNIEIVKALKEQSCITDETAMMMLNMKMYVQDLGEEIKKAREEQTEKQSIVDANSLANQGAAEDELLNGDEDEPLTPEEEELANAPAK